ncbi:phenylacetate-CoA oxygenase subunit PaaJ [Hyphobacterium sp. CCMP332]|nr:phenylacetate-CoA oxygenase subunit PaaJ [Hyphobacterium sp. CCMP332]
MVDYTEINKDQILEWLEEVKDPEIPVLSLVDLGVIKNVKIEKNLVEVDMTPTFVGCPAMDYMQKDVEKTLEKYGIDNYQVNISFKEPWTSKNISEKGRKALKEFGLAPPREDFVIVDIDLLEHVACPYCDSTNTELKTPFGPTLCRSLHYCHDCQQAFEQFKPV